MVTFTNPAGARTRTARRSSSKEVPTSSWLQGRQATHTFDKPGEYVFHDGHSARPKGKIIAIEALPVRRGRAPGDTGRLPPPKAELRSRPNFGRRRRHG